VQIGVHRGISTRRVECPTIGRSAGGLLRDLDLAHQPFVGFRDFLETVRGCRVARVAVGMVGARQPAVRLLDLFG
jgi:hypothetical protein